MGVSPEELLARLGIRTEFYAADDAVIFGAVNDKERAIAFAVDRRSGNFRWRVENISGWVMAPPIVWGGLCILGTSVADMTRREGGGKFAAVSWRRGGVLYAFEALKGAVRFWDERTGVVRETPRVEGDILIVEGEIRLGGFENEAPWSASAEVESRFSLPEGRLRARRIRGEAPPGYFEGEPPPGAWR
ncbi:MAG: hypothetical protein O2807_04440 [bacterium]|nr:hypothetical protein [bacterium]